MQRLIASGLLILVSSCFGAALAATQRDANDCNQTANFDLRLRGCTRLIQDRRLPAATHAIAYLKRGEAHYFQDDLDGAVTDLSQAIQIAPNSETYIVRGQAYAKKGYRDYGRIASIGAADLDRAIADFSQAILLNRSSSTAYLNRGIVHYRKGEHDAAIADYTEAIRLNPTDAQAYNNRGAAYSHKHELDRAISDYSDGIRLNPRRAFAYYNRGLIYRDKGDRERSIADFQRAAAIDPNYEEPRAALRQLGVGLQ